MFSGPFCQHGFKVQIARDSVEVWASVGEEGRGGERRGEVWAGWTLPRRNAGWHISSRRVFTITMSQGSGSSLL